MKLSGQDVKDLIEAVDDAIDSVESDIRSTRIPDPRFRTEEDRLKEERYRDKVCAYRRLRQKLVKQPSNVIGPSSLLIRKGPHRK